MLDAEEFDRWRASADDPLAAAAEQRAAARFHWACFLCEQAAQMAAKALLHGLGLDAWGHDVVALADRIASDLEERLAADVNEALVRLSRHFIASRYPDAHPSGTAAGHYTDGDAAQALTDAALVLRFVDRRWELLVAEARPIDEPAGHDGAAGSPAGPGGGAG